MRSENACFRHTVRKTRSDKTSQNLKHLVYDWWTRPQSSRLTGNKKDVKRERQAHRIFVSHPVQILEKTQTEIYEEFCQSNPGVKICQRYFE